MTEKNCLISEITFNQTISFNTKKIYQYYNSDDFKQKNSIERNFIVNENLIKLIQKSKSHFCFSEIVNYLQYVSKKNILDSVYNFTAFERYLNQETNNLSSNKKYFIRGKIVGKYILREDYQTYFPIAKGKIYYGTHTVTAHNPPDLDSTTASFISWLDAFGCHVSNSLTVWNIPQGKPGKLITSFFEDIFPEAIFHRVAKKRSFISSIAMDIVQKKNLKRAKLTDNIRNLKYNHQKNHTIVVDDNGYYIDDWRNYELESVGRVQKHLNMWFHFYEKEFIDKIFNLFHKDQVKLSDVKDTLKEILDKKVLDLSLFSDQYHEEDKKIFHNYLQKVLTIKEGCNTTKRDLLKSFDISTKTKFEHFFNKISRLTEPKNYCSKGKLILSRSQIFKQLKDAYKIFRISSTKFREYTETLAIALKTKTNILGLKPQYVTTKSLISEIKQIMKDNGYSYVTVNYVDKNKRLIPVGVLHRSDIYNQYLGTVSLRDFSNHDEIKLGEDIKTISIIDHHRSELSSDIITTIKIEDVQSCNIILAKQAFAINDSYPQIGRTLEEIEQEIQDVIKLKDIKLQLRLQQRLLSQKQAFLKTKKYFISPVRKLKEYLLFLNAIIDDTDLLAKAGWCDLYVTAELLNRIKSLQLNKILEIIDITYLAPTNDNLKKAKTIILQDPDMLSFYKKIYIEKENTINEIITQSKNKNIPYFFVDRKIQKSCCSVSQAKLFPNNWKAFKENRDGIINKWLRLNKTVHSKKPEVDFFLQMNSTISSHKEAYNSLSPNNENQDEIWLSANQESDSAITRIVQFIKLINNNNNKDINLKISIEGEENIWGKILLRGLQDQEVIQIQLKPNDNLIEPLIILTFNQASLNSRKSDITPYLPQ